jgi:hypothetical protein
VVIGFAKSEGHIMTHDSAEHLRQDCQDCTNFIEFPAHGLGREIMDPHCGTSIVLKSALQDTALAKMQLLREAQLCPSTGRNFLTTRCAAGRSGPQPMELYTINRHVPYGQVGGGRAGKNYHPTEVKNVTLATVILASGILA